MPVTTRRQHDALSPLTLNNLPTEILHEIASHLGSGIQDSDNPDDPDVEYDRMSIISLDTNRGADPDRAPVPQPMPCCRPGDEK